MNLKPRSKLNVVVTNIALIGNKSIKKKIEVKEESL